MEYITARDSGAVLICRRGGTVDYVDSGRIIIRVEAAEDGGEIREAGVDIYPLIKFRQFLYL
jgi:DNA-directed RNA polymerase subunit beta